MSDRRPSMAVDGHMEYDAAAVHYDKLSVSCTSMCCRYQVKQLMYVFCIVLLRPRVSIETGSKRIGPKVGMSDVKPQYWDA